MLIDFADFQGTGATSRVPLRWFKNSDYDELTEPRTSRIPRISQMSVRNAIKRSLLDPGGCTRKSRAQIARSPTADSMLCTILMSLVKFSGEGWVGSTHLPRSSIRFLLGLAKLSASFPSVTDLNTWHVLTQSLASSMSGSSLTSSWSCHR